MGERDDVRLNNGGVELTFYWSKDRFQHRFVAESGHRESVDPEALFTPVLTELHRQDGLLFLSGHGRWGHWSASVEAASGGILFDVACRCTSPAPATCSAYEGEGLNVEATGDRCSATELSRVDDLWIVGVDNQQESPPYTVNYRYLITT